MIELLNLMCTFPVNIFCDVNLLIFVSTFVQEIFAEHRSRKEYKSGPNSFVDHFLHEIDKAGGKSDLFTGLLNLPFQLFFCIPILFFSFQLTSVIFN